MHALDSFFGTLRKPESRVNMPTSSFFVTGANRGIGLGFVREILNRGNSVVASCRHPDKSKELQDLKKEVGGRLRLETLDVSDEKSFAALRARLKDLKLIDVLICNAGVYLDKNERIENLNAQIIRETFETNVLGAMRTVQLCLPFLRQSSFPKIIQISSMMGSISDNKSGGYYGYRISKTALNMFNKCLTFDFPEGPAVVFHPGWVQTDMGGAGAQVSIEKSVAGMLKTIDSLKKTDTGKFFTYEGKEFPW